MSLAPRSLLPLSSHDKGTQDKVYRVRLVFCEKKHCIFRLGGGRGAIEYSLFSQKILASPIYFPDYFGILEDRCRSPFLTRPIHAERRWED